ncbi:MAG: hypothetical protein ACRDHZ_00265 [Ktedonobacteraceae bacterium]
MMVLANNVTDRLTQTIQVLQQLQRLLPTSATLEDVADLLACVEIQYGAECPLENVIQGFVREHIAMQMEQRAAARRVRQTGHVEVAA